MALTTVPASLSATALTLTTAAQPNITSVGTLTGLTVSGNIAGTLTTAAQTNITSLGTLTSLTVDDITINGSTISDAADFTIDVGGDIILDADGADIIFKDGGTQFGKISKGGGSDLVIDASIADKDIFFTGTDGSTLISALTLDMSEGGAALFNKPMTVDGHTSSVASIFEGNGNGDTVPVQLKVKANDGSTSTQGLYGNAGSTSTGNTIVLGNSGSSGIMYRSAGTMYLTDPDAGNYVAQFTDQVKANAIAVGPYATFGTDYSSWQTNVGWNVRPKIGTQYTGFEAATGYYTAGASKMSLAGRTFSVTYWTPTAIGSSSIGSGYNVISTASSGATTLGNTNDVTDHYVLKVQSNHGLGEQGSHNGTYYHHNTDRSIFYFSNRCEASGGFHTYSDERLKEEITPVTGALDSVAKMNGVTFKWKNADERGGGFTGKHFGVTAQNMLEVDPELPELNKDPLYNIKEDVKEDDEYYTMDYSRLSPYFIEAIKELKEKLEAAEARITELEG